MPHGRREWQAASFASLVVRNISCGTLRDLWAPLLVLVLSAGAALGGTLRLDWQGQRYATMPLQSPYPFCAVGVKLWWERLTPCMAGATMWQAIPMISLFHEVEQRWLDMAPRQ